MNVTLDYLKSNRKWLVRDYVVWGDNGSFETSIVLTEIDTGNDRVVFNREFTGDGAQVVNFADLVDHRGNQLPMEINNPAIIIIPKNPVLCFVSGSVGSKSFRLARDAGIPSDSIVDLLITEMN